jgi:hypothetical protein
MMIICIYLKFHQVFKPIGHIIQGLAFLFVLTFSTVDLRPSNSNLILNETKPPKPVICFLVISYLDG